MDKQNILGRLDIRAFYIREIPSLKVNGSGKAMGRCPFHDDHDPSLSVDINTGFFNCFGCGTKGSIFDFYMIKNKVDFPSAKRALANEAGLQEASPSTSQIAKIYDYTDAKGNLVSQTVRCKPVGDKKQFWQRRPNGHGGYIWNLKGVQVVPYNLPNVLQAKDIFVVEGEKDADTLNVLGLVASTNPGGAGKWRPDFNEHFQGKRVVILPDNDEVGKKHAQMVAGNLKPLTESVKVVELPGLDVKGDVSDWIKQGGTKERLIELIKAAPEWIASDLSNCPPPISGKPDTCLDPLTFLQKGSDLQRLDCKVEWVIDSLLPKQSITLLHGRGGIGKTWLCLILADAISKGSPFMGLNTQSLPVVFVDFENSLPVLIERVRKIKIEDVLFWHNTNEVLAPPKLDSLKWEPYKTLPKGSLLVFDTLRASQSQDENDSRQMAFVMARLKELRDAGFTILLLHHTPKSNDRTYKGSTVILDLADHVLSLHKVRKNNLEETADDEESADVLYRLGTRDKTRYEPYHLFMAFDPEKGFVKAADPDEEDLQAIQEILSNKGTMNQGQLFETVKVSLGINSKGRFYGLLKKGESKFWISRKDKRAVIYEALSIVQLSGPIGADNRTIQEKVSEIFGTVAPSLSEKSFENQALSSCPREPQTAWTRGGKV